MASRRSKAASLRKTSSTRKTAPRKAPATRKASSASSRAPAVDPADLREVVVITGAASGIGRRLAQLLAAPDRFLFLTDRNTKGLAETAASLAEARAEAAAWPVEIRSLDVRRPAEWERLMQACLQRCGRIDVLLNTAGVIQPGYVHASAPADVDLHFDVNAKGLIYGTQAAARRMVAARSGRIVNFASLAGVAPIPGIALYSASKHAVRGFSLAACEELEQFNVQLSVVCPDAVQTPMLDLQVDYEEAALTFSGNRFLTADDVARTVIQKILNAKRPPRELLLPAYRGWLAKLGAAWPAAAHWLAASLRKKGAARQQKLRTRAGL